MAFTASHYIEVARIIREGRAHEADLRSDHSSTEAAYDCGYEAGFVDAYREAQGRLAKMFQRQNPKFDRARFDKDCTPGGNT